MLKREFTLSLSCFNCVSKWIYATDSILQNAVVVVLYSMLGRDSMLKTVYTMEEVGAMISRYGALYTFSLVDNLIPKRDFFLTMDYSKAELVKFP